MKRILILLVSVGMARFAAADFINGTFDTDTNWTKVGTVTISGTATLGGGGNNRGAVYQTISTTAGEWYRVTFDKGHAGSVNLPSGLMVTAFDGTGNSNANAYWGQSHVAPDKTGITAWFQALSGTTTIQFRDFNYDGASHDVRVDNASVVSGIYGPRDEVNIAHSAALSQSSFYDATTYPAAYGTDGVPNNFMHTAATDYAGTYTMTFATDQIISRVAISSREASYRNRVGNNLYLYDAADNLIDTVTITDAYYNNMKSAAGYWQGVRKIVVEEDAADSQPLNFAEVEVYTAGQINVAPLGLASASSVHSSFGADPARAIDESSDYISSATVYHSGTSGGDWWMDEFEYGYTIRAVEIQARREAATTPYNDRIGTLLEFLDANGDTLYTEAITPSLLWTLAGTWEGVYGVRITDEDSYLNLAEVRLFADTSVAPIPEPATMLLLALGGMALWRRRRK